MAAIVSGHAAPKKVGFRRRLQFYSLDAIISVGYRVNSAQATQFRIWAGNGNRKLTQAELANFLNSSQSRGAKMEAADPSVTIDLTVAILAGLRGDGPWGGQDFVPGGLKAGAYRILFPAA